MKGIHETLNLQSRKVHTGRSIYEDEPGFSAKHLAIVLIIHPR